MSANDLGTILRGVIILLERRAGAPLISAMSSSNLQLSISLSSIIIVGTTLRALSGSIGDEDLTAEIARINLEETTHALPPTSTPERLVLD